MTLSEAVADCLKKKERWEVLEMAGRTLAKGRQTGAHFEIKSMADCIRIKESMGKDASFERSLLAAWAEYPGYESTKEVLAELDRREG